MNLRQGLESGAGARTYARKTSSEGYGLRLFGGNDWATRGRVGRGIRVLCHVFLQTFLVFGFHVVLRLDLNRNAGVTNDGTHLQILIGMPAGQSLFTQKPTDGRQSEIRRRDAGSIGRNPSGF